MLSESQHDLSTSGFKNLDQVYSNLHIPRLYEEALRRREGELAEWGPLVVRSGLHTGRSPNDKFVVEEPSSKDEIWWGPVNRPFDPGKFDELLDKVLAYFDNREVFVQDIYASANPAYRLPVRVVTEMAWHSLFARNMFIVPSASELSTFEPQFTLIHAPGYEADPEIDGTRTGTFVLIHFARKIILIGGSHYTGEIKKSVFTLMNYLLPRQGVLTMHCSANEGEDGSTALFFGLSGTGKTTLSSDSTRMLIGDDEHGWDEEGVFNIEGGCYAKVINLSLTGEPEIYQTTRMFGTVLENVIIDPVTGVPDFANDSLTENTRGSYPIDFIPNAKDTGLGGHPRNIIFLTADAFGVMPPISKLTRNQAMYHFLSGYTAKVAGTERGLGSEPQATFSTCFGAPFLPLHPGLYSHLLGEKIDKHNVDVWLVNTGWTGGPYGVGHRMSLGHTRSMVRAILDGSLASVETRQEPFFGLQVPLACPGVPGHVLDARASWADGSEYDVKAAELAGRFITNMKQYEGMVPAEIISAGPPH
jgi:phosphoenolpyruvate carboxykinase (ATP)